MERSKLPPRLRNCWSLWRYDVMTMVTGVNPLLETAPEQSKHVENDVTEHVSHLSKYKCAVLRPMQRRAWFGHGS